MPRKTINVFMIILMVFSLAGCTKPRQPDPVDPTPADTAAAMDIVDRDGNLLGQIPADATCTAIDGGIFYSLSHRESNYSTTSKTDYYCFLQETKQIHHVATIANQSYENTFCRSELDGKIYTLVLEGNPSDNEPDVLELLVIDKSSMQSATYTVSEHGFPYAYLTVADGKILIMNHEMTEPKHDVIYEFVPEQAKAIARKTFDADTDSLRAVCGYQDGLCLFNFHPDGSSDQKISLDFYDTDYSLIKSQPFSRAAIDSIVENIVFTDRQDAVNELSMYVSHFSISDEGYLLYENFGMVRLAYNIQTDEVILIKNDTYSVSFGSGKPVLYRVIYEDDFRPEIIEITNGDPVLHTFSPADSIHRMLWSLSHSPSGTWLATMYDSFPLSTASVQLLLWSD